MSTVYIAVLATLMASFFHERVCGDPLFAYGDGEGDREVTVIGTQDTAVTLPVPLRYYGQAFRTAYILKDGMVGLEAGARFVDWEWQEGMPNPAIDLPFIAPFHHEGFLPLAAPDAYPGKIYYKLISRSRNAVDMPPRDIEALEAAEEYVYSASVALKAVFTADYMLRVTWQNVSSTDCDFQNLPDPGCPSNTFQLVIIGDTSHTFAIFNYYKMDIPFKPHQLAGLNGGHGRGWTDVVPCTGRCAKRVKADPSRVRALAGQAGSDVTGRYVMQVDGDVMVRGGCIPQELKAGTVEVSPRHTSMFGGQMLAVSAACGDPGTPIYCRFARTEVTRGVMETAMRGRCPVPMLTTRGRVLLEVSSDGATWRYSTRIHVVLPSRMEWPVDVTDVFAPWFDLRPDELKLRWFTDMFSGNPDATLTLDLYGYREHQNEVEVRLLTTLARDLRVDEGEVTLDDLDALACRDRCEDFQLGMLKLTVDEQFVDVHTKYQSVNLGPVMLGWWKDRAMTSRYGVTWPEAQCEAWRVRDEAGRGEHLLPCPCTLRQALADWGRWQPDMGCNMFTGSKCYYHQGAKHCVRSVHPTAEGAGNQCCYDDGDHLMYAADTYEGSTPDWSHDWGAYPFAAPGRVPSLSHWLADVVPFYHCCLWVDRRLCSVYMERRATRDCKAYTAPHAAMVYGVTHAATWDGETYSMGGEGEFWLVKSQGLNVQGRFTQRQNEYLQLSGAQLAPSNLSAVSVWWGDSDVITVSKAPPGGVVRRALDVKVNGRRVLFDQAALHWQDFREVSIVNNAGSAQSDANRQHSNFTLMFSDGSAVQVAARQGLLQVIVILPPGGEQVHGLLGTRDGDVTNDFTAPSGEVVPGDTHDDNLFFRFIVPWNVSRSESRFHWPRALTTGKTPIFGDFDDLPAYSDPSQQPTVADLDRVCGSSKPCRRDYYVTASPEVAAATRAAQAHGASLNASHARVETCGLLDIPMAAKDPRDYTLGSVVTVTGCRPGGSEVQGPGATVYACRARGQGSGPQWDPQPQRDLCPQYAAQDEIAEKASDIGMIVGIVVGVVAMLVIIIGALIILVRRRNDSTLEEVTSQPVPAKRSRIVKQDVLIDPGTDEKLLKRKERDRNGVQMSELERSCKTTCRDETCPGC